VDTLFSEELKELISKSRETAIDLGYDYISTIHFFIADCESKNINSILNFGFSDEKEFRKFKSDYTLAKTDYLELVNESLPLTKEAETTLRLTETERMLWKQTKAYPCHLFLASLKNPESLLSECFKHDINALDSLTTYYKELGDFTKSKMSDDRISREYYLPNENNKYGVLDKIISLFKRKK
jgi:hypothetical protein